LRPRSFRRRRARSPAALGSTVCGASAQPNLQGHACIGHRAPPALDLRSRRSAQNPLRTIALGGDKSVKEIDAFSKNFVLVGA
jgi:hypothetical protein